MNKVFKAHLALLAVNLLYGANFTIAKEVMPQHIEPFGFVLLRVLGSLPLFWLCSALLKEKPAEKKDIPKMLLLAVFGVAVNQLMFLKGLSLTTPINSAILMITSPILVLALASVIIKEKLSAKKTVGIALGFGGAFTLFFGKGEMSFSSDTFLGDFYTFINALSWGMYLVLARPLMQKYSAMTIVKWVFLFGMFMVLPFGYGELSAVQWENISFEIWLCIFYVVFLTTFVAYLLNTYALNALNPSVVSSYIYLQPFLASLIAIYFGKDELDAIRIFSGVLIFSGVYLVSQEKK